VTLKLHSTSAPIKLHKDIICKHCPFFDKAFNGSFEEAASKHINLESEELQPVQECIRWIYSGGIFQEAPAPDFLQLCKLWVLADKWCMPTLQNLVIDRLEKEAKRKLIPGSTITYIYSKTLPNSKLRGIANEICAWNMSEQTFRTTSKEYPDEFWKDLCGALLKKRQVDMQAYYISEADKNKKFEKRGNYYV
jgi:BTB/POZ domain